MATVSLPLASTLFLASYASTYANARNGQTVTVAEYPCFGQYNGGGQYRVNQVGLSFDQSGLSGPALEANLILTVTESYGATIEVREHDWTEGSTGSFVSNPSTKRLLGSLAVAEGVTGDITIPLNVIGRRSPFKVILTIADQTNNVAPTGDDTILFAGARLEVLPANKSETITTEGPSQQWPINGRLKVYAEVIGGGGVGSMGQAGGGGAYSADIVTFPASQPYTYLQVAWSQTGYAQNGNATVGHDTWFDGGGGLMAKGGNGSIGGQASAGRGAIRFSGGSTQIVNPDTGQPAGIQAHVGGCGASASAFGDGGDGLYNAGRDDIATGGTSPGAGGPGQSHVEGGGGAGGYYSAAVGGTPGGGSRAATSTRGQIRIWWFVDMPTGNGGVSLSTPRVQSSSTFVQPPRQLAGIVSLASGRVQATGQTIVIPTGNVGVSLRSPRVETLSTFAPHPAAPSIPGGSPGTGTWNEARKSYEFILTNGGLTATHNRGYNASGSIYGTDGITNGDHTFKVTVTNANGGVAIGVANTARSMTATLGWSANDIAVNTVGTILYLNQNLGSIGSITAGTTVEIRIKDRRFYVRKPGDQWNGSASISPEAGNGPDISGISGSLYPVVFGNNAGLSFTGDFTAWNGTVGAATPGNWAVGVVSLKGPFTSAEAGQNTQAAATVSLSSPSTSAQGFRGVSSNGAITLSSPSAQASGSHTRIGSGSVSLTVQTQGSGAHGVAGSSSISLAPKVDGSAEHRRAGSGVVSMASPAVAGDVLVITGANGAISLSSPSTDASGHRGARSDAAVLMRSPAVQADGSQAVGANGSVSLAQPTVEGTADHGAAGAGAVTLIGPSLEAYAEHRTVAETVISLTAPAVEGQIDRGATSEAAITLGSPAVAGETETKASVGGAISLAAPTVEADGGHGIAGEASVSLASPSVEGSGLMVPSAVVEASLTAPRVSGVMSQTGYARIVIAAPVVDADADHGVGGYGVVELSSPTVEAEAGHGVAGEGSVTLWTPKALAEARRGSSSDGAIPIGSPRLAGVFEHAVGAGGSISLHAPTTLADASHGVSGEGAISLASPTVTGSLEPGLVHGSGGVVLGGVAVDGAVFIDLTTIYTQGAISLSSPGVKGRALTLPTHGQRTVVIEGEQRVVAPPNEARSLNIPTEERVALIEPE